MRRKWKKRGWKVTLRPKPTWGMLRVASFYAIKSRYASHLKDEPLSAIAFLYGDHEVGAMLWAEATRPRLINYLCIPAGVCGYCRNCQKFEGWKCVGV